MLAHARRLPDPESRAAALTALVPHLPPGRQHHAGTAALATATAITSKPDRVHALAGLVPHLSREQLAGALTTVTAITGEADRARVTAQWAPCFEEFVEAPYAPPPRPAGPSMRRV